MTDKRATSFRLSDNARTLLVVLAEKLGVSQTDIVELAVRKIAQSEGVEIPKKK